MKLSYMFIFYFMSIGLLLGLGGCKQPQQETQSEFYYYPKTNMYFDVAKNSYIFSLDGAKTWDTLDATSQNQPEGIGDKIVIYAPNDSIWIDNEAHRRAYQGVLYDIYDADTISAAEQQVVTEKKVVKKARAAKKVEIEEEEKPKKGLKKFINKIFGKRKDKKERD